MRKLILPLATAAAFSGSAFAADLPGRTAPAVYPVSAPIFTWTGFYAGVNAGYAFDTDHSFRTTGVSAAQVVDITTGLRPSFIRNRSSGFTGGGQVGFNYQFGAGSGVVVGVEADAQYDGPSRTTLYTSGAFQSFFRSRTNYVGTIRGRLGYAFDNFLFYATGGFAYGGLRDDIAFINAAGLNSFGASRRSMRSGYAYGGGVEYAVPTTSFLNFFHASAITLKAEFIHYDLGTSNNIIASATTTNSFTTRIRTQGNLLRAGINYKVDLFGAPTSVVARY